MNVENNNAESATDLRLALSYSDNSIQRRSNNDKSASAGANAASSIEMTFVATDPISELVWSPQRGLSLKCTERSFPDKKPSHLLGAGPSNVVFPARIASNDKLIDEDYYNRSLSMFHANTKISDVDTFQPLKCHAENGKASSSGDEEQKDNDNLPGFGDGFVGERSTSCKESFHHLNEKNDPPECEVVDMCGANDRCIAKSGETLENISLHFPDEQKVEAVQIECLLRNSVGETRDIDPQNQMAKLDRVFPSKVHGENQYKSGELQVLLEESTLFKEEESEKRMKRSHSPSPCLFEILETTAENDLPTMLKKKVHVATSNIATSESAHELRRNSQQDQVELQQKNVSSEHCPTNSRIKGCRRKGKEKALSDVDVEGRMSKDEDDSHESVESCNSARIISTGKKRWSFEQKLIVGSKRVKKQIQETPGSSSSFVEKDSSFMNWISNMIKGFPKVKHEMPSLALTLAHSTQGHENSHQKLATCNENKHHSFLNIGFQSIFHSIYCPKLRVDEPRAPNENYRMELDIACKTCDIDATPIACREENIKLGDIFLRSKGIAAGSANQIDLPTAGSIQRNSDSNSEENKNPRNSANKVSCNFGSAAQKDGTSSSSSLGKHRIIAAVKIDSDPPSGGKAADNITYRSDPLGSSWITRFTPKISGLLSNQDAPKQSIGGSLESPNDCCKLLPCPEAYLDYSNDLMVPREECEEMPSTGLNKELRAFRTDVEASGGFSKITDQNGQKSIFKLNTIMPSPRLKNSEAMASLFARRLDALKHIVSSGAAHETATCFFCGKKGHHLRDCSDITETVLKDIVNNMKLYKRVDELPVLCIRCFQLNHWAVSCPNASPRGQHQSDCGTSFLSCDKKCDEEDLEPPKKQSATGVHIVCSAIDTRTCVNLDRVMTAYKMRSSTNLQETCVASSSRAIESKEGYISPLCSFTNQQPSDTRKGIFEAIKMLRLSRTDILKWMNSKMALSCIDGFFLRLRLAKWEEGLSSTGYYVACITGANREMTGANLKNSIYVNVGGVNFSIGSQYISNHDFIEDELKAWWFTTTRSGCTIPSEEDLRNKVKERRMLGF